MKKILFLLTIAIVTLSSCLKDKPNTDFSKIGTVLELPYSGLQYFSTDAVTDAGDTIVKSFGINIASKSPLSTATNYTIVVDNSLITAYNASQSAIVFQPMPEGSYTISKLAGTIPAGQRLDSVTVTFYKALLDPSKSYILPIALKSTSNGILSGNFNAHYYHFIGNDFAGSYSQTFERWNATDSTSVAISSLSFTGGSAILSPVSPTEFTVGTGYAGGKELYYDVTFTKTGTGPTAMYSNFNVAFTPASVAQATADGIAILNNPMFLLNGGGESSTVAGPFTYAQALKIFHFQFVAQTSAPRYIVDKYYK